ncbi:MAG: DNA-protecting protein DprA [Armatimonadetes bacterium]|nr:DNA-protecting protein DprA [Armatimonadota bacterium]
MAYEIETDEAGAENGVATRFAPTANESDPANREFIACHKIASADLPAHRVRALLESGATPSVVLSAGATVWQSSPIGLTEKQVGRLKELRDAPLDPKLLARAVASGTVAVLSSDPSYPATMRDLSDAPPILWVRGELLPGDRYGIAVVGTRRASNYGLAQASRFAAAFAAQGLTVISGGALGIDAAAHTGALDAGGRTVAVLGCGVDIVYPAAHRALFERILQNGRGAIVSEFPLQTKPEPWRFPTRNRIIAGMARASVLVETPDKSGALGTARFSAEYGRDVYAVPGAVDTGASRGGHKLIQDGAILADSPEDVLTSLGIVIAAQEEPIPRPRREPVASLAPVVTASEPKVGENFVLPVTPVPPKPVPSPDLPPGESVFYAALSAEPLPFDTVAQAAGLSAPEANVAATLLEMKSLIRRFPGNLFSRV